MDIASEETAHKMHMVVDMYGEQYDDYCYGCQQEGPDQLSGFKTHRNFPTDVRWVEIAFLFDDNTFGSFNPEGTARDPDGGWRYFILCADCLGSAKKSGYTVVVKPKEELEPENEKQGKEFIPVSEYEEWDGEGMMFLREEIGEFVKGEENAERTDQQPD